MMKAAQSFCVIHSSCVMHSSYDITNAFSWFVTEEISIFIPDIQCPTLKFDFLHICK